MKLVLSRKGFDSGYGGMPSPILPDGRLISLPIPSRNDSYTLADINFPGIDIAMLIGNLSKGRLDNTTQVHLDPDLNRSPTARLEGWRPALGQTSSAQSHLANCGVGPGDVFLFFGWFRETEFRNGTWHYVKGAPDLHVLFGWLEIDHVLSIVTQREASLAQFPWIANHPHVASPNWYNNELNTLYVARKHSLFAPSATFGAGRFLRYRQELQLTKPGSSRSVWTLPAWFAPNGRTPLSYHSNPAKWTPDANRVTLQSAAKGQEFVIDGERYPELEEWVGNTILQNSGGDT
jgi:hypothetical protein